MTEWPLKDWLKTVLGLGITPAEFWQLSLTDWFAITGQSEQPMNREVLDALIEHYPDTERFPLPDGERARERGHSVCESATPSPQSSPRWGEEAKKETP